MKHLIAAVIMTALTCLNAQSESVTEKPLYSPVTSLLPARAPRAVIYDYVPVDTIPLDSVTAIPVLEGDSVVADLIMAWAREEADTFIPRPVVTRIRPYSLRPAVFSKVRVHGDTLAFNAPPAVEAIVPEQEEFFDWINEEMLRGELMQRTRQHYVVYNPGLIIYNEAHLPEPPKHFTATVDPETASIVLKEVIALEAPAPVVDTSFDKIHWLRKFNSGLQFSQAYVSPNWYQGGNNNLNALLNLYYEVKLNQAFHPKWIFDNTFQYKLGMNNAPDDKLRDYSISQDILQWNMTAGYKSTRRWYYSVSAQFKTQLLNNYKSNTRDLKAAFLSPGELNVGVGMTYTYANKKKTFTFDASISPLSWNMKSCINKKMNETSFGIKEGHKVVNEIGSSAEGKLSWKLTDNISLASRLFVFTDYGYIQGDWENTLNFAINRFLTTRLYVHARYDSSTTPAEDSDWRKLELKEILSLGFSYTFSTI